MQKVALSCNVLNMKEIYVEAFSEHHKKENCGEEEDIELDKFMDTLRRRFKFKGT